MNKGELWHLIKNDDRFLRDRVSIPGRYFMVKPKGSRLRAADLVNAYLAVGRPMDKHRMSRMMQAYKPPPSRSGIGTMKSATTLSNVLMQVFNIDLDPKELFPTKKR